MNMNSLESERRQAIPSHIEMATDIQCTPSDV